MSFEKGDRVVLHDKHSEFDGEVGEISQVSETMFGDNTYILTFDEGQEAGIPEDALEPAEGVAEESAEGVPEESAEDAAEEPAEDAAEDVADDTAAGVTDETGEE